MEHHVVWSRELDAAKGGRKENECVGDEGMVENAKNQLVSAEDKRMGARQSESAREQ